MGINPKSQVVRRGKKRWEKVVHTAEMIPYEMEKRWPGDTTGGRRTGPAVSDHHPGMGAFLPYGPPFFTFLDRAGPPEILGSSPP